MLEILRFSFKRLPTLSWVGRAVASASLAAMLACVSTPEPTTKQTKEAVENSQTDQTAATTVARETPKDPLQTFFEQQINEDSSFTPQDEQFLQTLPHAPAPGSLEEAAIAVGIAKYTLSQNRELNDKAVLLDQTDTTNTTNPASQKVSLEALALEKGIDLARAIKENPRLENLEFFKLCLHALKSSDNSASFTVALNETIAGQLRAWNTAQGTQSETAGVEALPTTGENLNADELTPDLRNADNLLMEAQVMADNRHYQDAIVRVSQISDENPLRILAQEKVVEFSDLAVQELRQKAAQAFQNAIPVSDPKARAAYLVKAKTHLEQALQEYPNAPADQLTTVRENLAVISRDLEKLENTPEETFVE